jgi:prolyl oligopeptidase PreP (S9A serine peptidase family)
MLIHPWQQNVFDDAQAAAKYLIDNKIAGPKKICIAGGSNGGQYPRLGGCSLAD